MGHLGYLNMEVALLHVICKVLEEKIRGSGGTGRKIL